MSFENLPIELIIEILMRLPVKSLLRFRSVSKAFNAIISSRNFVYSHINVTLENDTHRQLIYRENKYSPASKIRHGEVHGLDMKDGSDYVFPHINIPAMPPFCTIFEAHCNGLVLLHTYFDELIVWNPSTRKSRKLAVCPIYIPHNTSGISKLGFGYDSSADDYKVVLIKEIEGRNIYQVQVWIFGLKSKSWRKIPDFPYREYKFIEGAEKGNCFVDGALHFLCRHDTSYIIVAFNLEKETFSIVSQPIYETQGRVTSLQVLRGCLFVGFSSFVIDQVELYIRRKRDGAEFTWSKLYSMTTKQCPDILRIGKLLGLSKHGDKILIFFQKRIHLYDIIDQTSEEIGIKSVHDPIYIDSYVCIESLVSVNLLYR